LAAVRALTAAGVVVSLGHTDATATEVRAAVDAGARAVTHAWNAMRPLHHREPGPLGVALTDDRLTVGLIADGVHVADDVLRLTLDRAGGRVALVTDATAASGGPEGTSSLAGVPVTVRAGEVRNADGALAGSATTLDACVRHVVGLGTPPAEAVAAASRVPARLLGDDTRGSLGAGARADLVLLDDELEVRAVVIGGRVVVDHDGRFAAVPA
ncbi:MAG: amidohydrolase family protein, partial [Actinobacteria bacterium]|nr:amidohydrolase family protein [Actinomycetota bacterium]